MWGWLTKQYESGEDGVQGDEDKCLDRFGRGRLWQRRDVVEGRHLFMFRTRWLFGSGCLRQKGG